jgi:hypothetical protein
MPTPKKFLPQSVRDEFSAYIDTLTKTRDRLNAALRAQAHVPNDLFVEIDALLGEMKQGSSPESQITAAEICLLCDRVMCVEQRASAITKRGTAAA